MYRKASKRKIVGPLSFEILLINLFAYIFNSTNVWVGTCMHSDFFFHESHMFKYFGSGA